MFRNINLGSQSFPVPLMGPPRSFKMAKKASKCVNIDIDLGKY
jgi:hypothetical protein